MFLRVNSTVCAKKQQQSCEDIWVTLPEILVAVTTFILLLLIFTGLSNGPG